MLINYGKNAAKDKEDKGRHLIVSEMLQIVNGVRGFKSIQKIILSVQPNTGDRTG